MKKISYVLIIRIAAIVMMIAALIGACLGSIQSTLPFLMPMEFQGEYSFDGETWHTLSKEPNIPAKYGSITIKGGFGRTVWRLWDLILLLFRNKLSDLDSFYPAR